MSFSVRLSTDLIAVEAGATVPLSIEVSNKGTETDRYELQIEGIDAEWTAVPEAVFVVDSGELHTEKVFFKVPRTSESLAGNYPFVVKVRSLNSGDARTAQGVVQVKPFHYLTTEISPKKGFYSPGRKQNTYTVTILNLGNTDHTLQLFGNDPDEALAYDFEHEQLSVSPGQQKSVELEVAPSSTPFLSSSRLFGFSVSARSVELPNVMTSSQAQIEQRPLLTPATLISLILVFLVGIAWFALLPKPPSISLNLSRSSVYRGESVKIGWHTQNSTRVLIKVDGESAYDGPGTDQGIDYVPARTGDLTIEAQAFRDQKPSEGVTSILHVDEPPPVPKPVVSIKAKRRSINLGETVELNYTVENAEEAYLQPTGQKLPLSLNSVVVQPSTEGTFTYEIVATGKDKSVARDKVTVTVIDKAKVVILAFSISPNKFDSNGGYATVSWQVSNAARVEITNGVDTTVPDDPNAPGSKEFMIDKTTTFTIKAIDANGKSVSKALKVDVADPVEPPLGPGDPGATPPIGGPAMGGGR